MTNTKGKLNKTLVCFQNEQTRHLLSKLKIVKLTQKVFKLLKLKSELHLTFVSDSQIRKINKLFHGTNKPTDVLAFENPKFWPFKTGRYLGEVIISVDRAVAYAKRFRCTRDEELIRYITHGILHLTGERDLRPAERKRMFAKQEKIIRHLKPIPKLIV